MNQLHRVIRYIAATCSELTTIAELRRCNDRMLADIGIERADIPHVARLAARSTPEYAAWDAGREEPGVAEAGHLAAA